MFTLFYAPYTASMAAQIALEEAGIAHEANLVDLSRGEHLQPDYLAINPHARVPALRLEDGTVLTEVAAILTFVAGLAPERELLPTSGLAHARAVEWFSFFASSLHVTFGQFFRPSLTTQDATAQGHVRRDALLRFQALLGLIDRKLPDGGYCLGDRFSLCDAHAFVFYQWGRAAQLPVEGLARYSQLAERVLARPAVARVLDAQRRHRVPELPPS